MQPDAIDRRSVTIAEALAKARAWLRPGLAWGQWIDHVVVGGGKRLFRDCGLLTTLRLVDSHMTTTGAILATYALASDQ